MPSTTPPKPATEFLFFSEETDFEWSAIQATIQWLESAFRQENMAHGAINIIACSDPFLHKLNVDYLDHDTLTDVITFPFSGPDEVIEGDIFISVDRVAENAKTYGVSFQEELRRVIIHGCLHLMGYTDKTPELQELMKQKENTYLDQFPSIN